MSGYARHRCTTSSLYLLCFAILVFDKYGVVYASGVFVLLLAIFVIGVVIRCKFRNLLQLFVVAILLGCLSMMNNGEPSLMAFFVAMPFCIFFIRTMCTAIVKSAPFFDCIDVSGGGCEVRKSCRNEEVRGVLCFSVIEGVKKITTLNGGKTIDYGMPPNIMDWFNYRNYI